ncbi:serine/threonine-protein kinase [Variovorax paradoxus]|nr:serine/threonine-protein kinase [Variovorax paradoxus]
MDKKPILWTQGRGQGRTHLQALEQLKLKDNQRVGFKLGHRIDLAGERKAVLFVTTRAKENLAKRAWNALIDRNATRQSAAKLAFSRIRNEIGSIPGFSGSANVGARLDELQHAIEASGSIKAKTIDALMRAVAEMPIRAAARQATSEAGSFFELSGSDLDPLKDALHCDVTCIKKFQAFVSAAASGDTAALDYNMAKDFCEKWVRASAELPQTIDRSFKHAVDSMVGMLTGPGRLEMPSKKEALIDERAFVDDSTLRLDEKNFRKPENALCDNHQGSVHVYEHGRDHVVVKAFAQVKDRKGVPRHTPVAMNEVRAHEQAQVNAGGESHVIGLKAAVRTPDGGTLVVLEHAPLGDANTLTRRIETAELSDKQLHPRRAQNVKLLAFADMLKGVAQAHDNGVMHLDIKPDNFFIDKHGKLLLGDFGTSKTSMAASMESGTAAPDFAAPEQLETGKMKKPGLITYKADIWSLGVILCEFVAPRVPGKGPDVPNRPFPYEKPLEGERLIEDFIKLPKVQRFEQLQLSQHNPLHQLVVEMLDPDPAKRPSVHQVLDHPEMKRFTDPGTNEEETVKRTRKDLLDLAKRGRAQSRRTHRYEGYMKVRLD